MRRAFFALGCSLTIAACAPDAVYVGNVSDDASTLGSDGSSFGDGGIEAGPATPLCYSDNDCDGGFCEFQECNPDAGGACRTIQADCQGVTAEEHPICGCDGVTYWNNCVRQIYHESARDLTAPCSGKNAAVCDLDAGGTSRCRLPNAMSCAVEFPPDISPSGEPGAPTCNGGHPMSLCWALPPGGCYFADFWQQENVSLCPNGPDATPAACSNVCDAIYTHQAFQPALGSSVCADAGSLP